MLERVGKECSNWLIHSVFLLMRSRIEKFKRKTVERAALQVCHSDVFVLAIAAHQSTTRYNR
jgi:hypothetical protein